MLQKLKKHAVKWREIRTYLKFHQGEISNIDARPNLRSGAPVTWLGAMLEEWIQWVPGDDRGSTSFATLTELKAALRKAGLGVTAHDLEL